MTSQSIVFKHNLRAMRHREDMIVKCAIYISYPRIPKGIQFNSKQFDYYTPRYTLLILPGWIQKLLLEAFLDAVLVSFGL